jgi:hypothetical protein
VTFKIGDRVRRKEMGTYLRLSFPGTETGTVVFVREFSDRDVRVHLDRITAKSCGAWPITSLNRFLNQALRSYRFALPPKSRTGAICAHLHSHALSRRGA